MHSTINKKEEHQDGTHKAYHLGVSLSAFESGYTSGFHCNSRMRRRIIQRTRVVQLEHEFRSSSIDLQLGSRVSEMLTLRSDEILYIERVSWTLDPELHLSVLH